jgi:hypothetical protein
VTPTKTQAWFFGAKAKLRRVRDQTGGASIERMDMPYRRFQFDHP